MKTDIPTRLVQDSSLSFGCRGMLIYLLTLPPGTRWNNADIERVGNIGSHRRRQLMIEAERAGYLVFKKQRDEEGRFDIHYDVCAVPVSQVDRSESWNYHDADKGICVYCGEQATQMDHVIPPCQGGTDDPSNKVSACQSCNSKKSNRTPEQANMEARYVIQKN